MAGTVPELICIVPGKAKFVPNCVTNVWARSLPVLIAVIEYSSSKIKLELYWARVGSNYSSTWNSPRYITIERTAVWARYCVTRCLWPPYTSRCPWTAVSTKTDHHVRLSGSRAAHSTGLVELSVHNVCHVWCNLHCVAGKNHFVFAHSLAQF